MSRILTLSIRHYLKENIFYRLDYGQSNYQFEVFRIAIALFSLVSFIFYILDFEILLSPHGLISWEVTNAYSYWFEPTLFKISNVLGADENTVLYSAIFAYCISLTAILFGVHVRIFAVAAFLLFKILLIQLMPYVHGVELYQTVCLLFLIVFPSGMKYSLLDSEVTDKKILHQNYAIRGLQLYMVFTYFSAGYHKALMPSWYNGEMFFMAISDPNYLLIDFPKELPYWVYAVFGILTIAVEMGYAFFLIMPIVRSVLILSIIGMHLMIVFFMSLVPFGLLLALLNLVLWYPLLLKDLKGLRSKKI